MISLEAIPVSRDTTMNEDLASVSHYRFADVVWQIQPQHRYLRELLRPYLVEETAEAVIPLFPGNWEQENDGVLQAVHEVLTERFNGLLFHSAALIYKEKAYLFAAPPGTGKSTHVLLWKECLGDSVEILNGDKPFLRLHGQTAMVYGGPWRGKEGLGINAAYPLGGIYLLRRGLENEVRASSTMEKLSGLLRATILSGGADQKSKVLSLLDELCRCVPVSLLTCNMQHEAVYIVKRHIDQGEL